MQRMVGAAALAARTGWRAPEPTSAGSARLCARHAGAFRRPANRPQLGAVTPIPGGGAVAAKGTLDLSGVLP
ncbi:MAG: hypothetical protein SF182_02350 [Deltaproteobacteria bacterium]|nr:hypothetical protein [Deltaproteobacteria bacterium]